MFLYFIGSKFEYNVINMKSKDHIGKVYDVIGNMTSQSIHDVIINFSPILWYFKIYFLSNKLAEVCTLGVLSSFPVKSAQLKKYIELIESTGGVRLLSIVVNRIDRYDRYDRAFYLINIFS